MLIFLYAILTLIGIFIVLAYLYSMSEMPDIPDWEEFGLEKPQLSRNR
jgi:hypothetical protein